MSEEPSPARAARPRQFGLARFLRLARKELSETLRDRRTIVTLVLMPVLLYPLLGVGLQQFLLTSVERPGEVSWQIAVASDEQREQLSDILSQGTQMLAEDDEAPPLPRQAIPAPTMPAAPGKETDNREPEPQPIIEAMVSDDVAERVRRFDADLGIRFHVAEEEEIGKTVAFQLFYRPNSPRSRAAAEFIERRLQAVNVAVLRGRLQKQELPTERPLAWQWRPIVEATTGGGGLPLAGVAPLVLILMTITGAVYPAIDLTAGERERGTLESLMAAPVPRLSLLGAKYVAVLTVALLTALANLLAMSITLHGTGLGAALLGPNGFSLQVAGTLFLLLALFAAFFSAVLLAVTCFARSFKEAQAYLIPLMLVALGPGFLSVAPGLELTTGMAVLPLANMVLLARDVMQGTVGALPAAIAVTTTALYAVAALLVAARIFGSDAVLYGSQASWGDALRRGEARQATSSPAAAWFTAAVLYPLYFLASSVLRPFQDLPPAWQLGLLATATILVFAATPLVFALWQRIDWRSGFQLRGARWAGFAGAVVLGVSLWPLAHELFLLVQQAGAGTLDSEQLRKLAPQIEQTVAGWRQVSPAWLLFCLAVVPATCEELFFRGYLLGSMRGRVAPWLAIGSTALLFGVFHLSVGGLTAVERVVSSMFLGLVLGTICWRTGSVLPGIVTHALHNGLLLSVAYWQKQLTGASDVEAGTGHLPAWWLGLAAVGVVVGAGLVWLGGAKQPADSMGGGA